MTTFAEVKYLQKQISTGKKIYFFVSIFFGFIIIPRVIEITEKQWDTNTIKFILTLSIIYLLIMYVIFWKMKKLKAALLACTTAIESDPVLVAEYHADKNQHDFDEAVQNIRNHIRDCYHKIELCERNGQYQMAAKYRGDISTLESKLRQLGC